MKTYVVVGLGGRSLAFRNAIANDFPGSAKLVAICDSNPGRLELAMKNDVKHCPDLKGYIATDFKKMLEEQSPDCVFVCTPDSTHDDYICTSLEHGCDVITEKPMTTDERKCQRIIDAVNQTGRQIRVAFNYRYSPPRSQIKEMLMGGVVGKILSVDFQWMLDTNHGADYFRRWHRNKANSGGLIVHKSAHHFDLVNWWVASTPASVFAEGDTSFYNENQAKLYGLEKHAQRCLNCQVRSKCNYLLDLSEFESMKELYLDAESHDGYFRDQCVFSDEIDIEDNLGVIVKYRNGVQLNYSLNAFSAWEGYRVVFNGTKGRLEHTCQQASYVNGDGTTIPGALKPEETTIRVYPHFKTPYTVEPQSGEGAHGGGDKVMFNDIFGAPAPDPLMRAADYVQGAHAILVGIAANQSMKMGRAVGADNLVTGLPEAQYPSALENAKEAIEYVENAERIAQGKRSLANIPMKLDAPE